MRNTCPKCGTRVKEDDLFCPSCGAKITSKEVKEEKPVITPPDSAHNHCSKCKAEISSSLSFCPKCGAKQIANCVKCGAKLSKTDDFCTSCGQKIVKPATFASNSVYSGVCAIFLGWIPLLGWMFIFSALIYGFLSLRRVKKGNTLENRKAAIAGIVLGFIALAIALSVSIHYMYGDGTDDSTSGIFGPTDAETTSVLKMSPVISQFMEEHPKSITHFYHYSLSEFDVNKNDILFYCNHDSAFIKKATIEPAEYSLVTMTDKESKLYIIAFINWDDNATECAVKGDATEEGIISPPDPEDVIPNAEKKLEETICRILPTNAIHFFSSANVNNDDYWAKVGIKIPKELAQEIDNLGDTVVFTDPLTGTVALSSTEDTYNTNCFSMPSGVAKDPIDHYCVMLIDAALVDENGERVAKGPGIIRLTFTGPLEPMKISWDSRCYGCDSYDLEFPYCQEFCNQQPIPTYTRTDCSVEFQKPCEEKPGKVLCTQCEYKSRWVDGAKPENLGKCFYCDAGQKCSWGVKGICSGNYQCSSGGSSPGGVSGQYYVSCSECRTTPPSYSYSGASYEWCNYYYNACVQSGCGKILDNCR